jgi:hypothetical protein
MDKSPFSVYDFFAYLVSGAIMLVFTDVLIGQDWLRGGNLTTAQFLFWTMSAYACGHLLATPAQALIEMLFTRKLLGHPTAIIMGSQAGRIKQLLFPGYFRPLPICIRNKILSNLSQTMALDNPETLFYEAFLISKNQPETSVRMNLFLGLYGFSRNLSFVSLLLLIISILTSASGLKDINCLFPITAGMVFLIFFYRHLKFYRLYALECLMGVLSRQVMEK